MSVLSVHATNFKVHSDLNVSLNKQSALVIGDSGFGKSSFMEIVLAHLGITKYPNNPLKEGEDKGFTELVVEAKNGKSYKIIRRFERTPEKVVLERFEVRDVVTNKKLPSLEYFMGEFMNGVFSGQKFDYASYFLRTKGPKERYDYFIEAIGGKVVDDIFTSIEELEKERAELGKQRERQEHIFNEGSYSEETAEADVIFYSQDRTIDEAQKAKDDYIKENTVDMAPFESALKVHDDAIGSLVKLEERLWDNAQNFTEIQNKIFELQKQLEDNLKNKDAIESEKKKVHKSFIPVKKLEKLQKDALAAETKNKEVKEQSAVIYNDKVNEIIAFGIAKNKFFDGIAAFEEYLRVDKEYVEIDEQIQAKKLTADDKFRELLPLPELSVGAVNGKPAIMYKGREFSADNLSKGETIEITSAIQLKINPTGDNFIVIPEAQSLGSKLPEIIAACKKFNVQFLVEITKPDQEFTVEIVES